MKPAELDLDNVSRRRPKAEGPKTKARKKAAWRAIARSLRIDGPQTANALATNLKLMGYLVVSILGFWTGRGLVEKLGRRYQLTAKGADIGKPRARRPRKALKPKPTVWDKIGGDD